MKRTIVSVCIFSLMLLSGCNKSSEDFHISRIEFLSHVRDIKMYGNEGWILTRNNELKHSNDGLESFVTVDMPKDIAKDTVLYSYFYDEDTCYISRYMDNENSLLISFTGDGGFTWMDTFIPVLYGCAGAYIHMLNEDEGYLLYCSEAFAGQMYKIIYYTFDGGISFKEYCNISDMVSGYPRAFEVTSEKRGYIAVDYRNEQRVTMYEAVDMGEWKEMTLETPEDGLYYSYDVPAYSGIGDVEGIMFVQKRSDTPAEHYFFYRTADGGHSWEQLGGRVRWNITGSVIQGISVNKNDSSEIYLTDSNGDVFSLQQ